MMAYDTPSNSTRQDVGQYDTTSTSRSKQKIAIKMLVVVATSKATQTSTTKTDQGCHLVRFFVGIYAYRLDCQTQGRVTRLVSYNMINDVQVNEPAGASGPCCCMTKNVLTEINIDANTAQADVDLRGLKGQ